MNRTFTIDLSKLGGKNDRVYTESAFKLRDGEHFTVAHNGQPPWGEIKSLERHGNIISMDLKTSEWVAKLMEKDKVTFIPQHLGQYKLVDGKIRCEVSHVQSFVPCFIEHENKEVLLADKVMELITQKEQISSFLQALVDIFNLFITSFSWDLLEVYHHGCAIAHALHDKEVIVHFFRNNEASLRLYKERFADLKKSSVEHQKYDGIPEGAPSLDTIFSPVGRGLFRAALAKALIGNIPIDALCTHTTQPLVVRNRLLTSKKSIDDLINCVVDDMIL